MKLFRTFNIQVIFIPANIISTTFQFLRKHTNFLDYDVLITRSNDNTNTMITRSNDCFFFQGNEISNVIYILHFNTCCAIFTITYWSMGNNWKEVSIYTSTESCEIVEIITILSILETLGLSASWPFYVITSLAFWLVLLLLFKYLPILFST